MFRRSRNWSKLNRKYIQSGRIDFWISPDVVQNWRAPQGKQRGRPTVCSESAIIALIMLKIVFHLSYRRLQGFAESLFDLLGVALPVPDYTRVCRRSHSVKLPKTFSEVRPAAIIYDSTGLKVFGEGEWKVKKHGVSKKRTWKKLHVGICADSQQIVVGSLTDPEVADCTQLPVLLRRIPEGIKEVLGDGAYDTKECHRAIHRKGAKPVIPPKRTAKLLDNPQEHWKERNDAAWMIACLGDDSVARGIWKKSKRYSRRSLVETTMSRLKGMLGPRLYSHRADAQQVECVHKLLVLNRIMAIGGV